MKTTRKALCDMRDFWRNKIRTHKGKVDPLGDESQILAYKSLLNAIRQYEIYNSELEVYDHQHGIKTEKTRDFAVWCDHVSKCGIDGILGAPIISVFNAYRRWCNKKGLCEVTFVEFVDCMNLKFDLETENRRNKEGCYWKVFAQRI